MKMRENIFLCDNIPSPFILGVFRPRIFLPSDIGEQALGYVSAHEKAHLKRGDNLWKPLGFAVLAVHWFNPLVWIAYILFCRDIELSCDEKVIKNMDSDNKKAYSETLLAYSTTRGFTACPVAFGEVGVKERVKGVLNYKKPAFWVIIIAVIACIVTGFCLLTNPSGKNSGDPFGKKYSFARIVYINGSYSFEPTDGNTPMYAVSEERELFVNKYGEWREFGKFTEIQLTKDNFSNYFKNSESWDKGSAGGVAENEPKSVARYKK